MFCADNDHAESSEDDDEITKKSVLPPKSNNNSINYIAMHTKACSEPSSMLSPPIVFLLQQPANLRKKTG